MMKLDQNEGGTNCFTRLQHGKFNTKMKGNSLRKIANGLNRWLFWSAYHQMIMNSLSVSNIFFSTFNLFL
jgi:hypothetical protein